MMYLTIICVGKLKEPYWKNAEAEYLKRLKPYAKITLIELAEEPFRSIAEKEKIQRLEAEKIKKHLSGDTVSIALHEGGREYTSKELATFLQEKTNHGEKLTFIIGGPLGLHPTFLTEVRFSLSLSQLTFPHQMVRTILLEQLYRSMTILTDKQYHY